MVAETPVVDTTSNEVGSNYDRNWVENAPLRRYSFFDLVKSSPGTLDGGDGSRRSMVYGSGYDENSFQLDGVDITENFFNESSAEPNVDAIEEVEVLSLGAPAEYGNLTGAVFNIVTRQGTNQFHGDVNFFYQSDGLTSNNTEGLKNPDGSFVDTCGDNRCPFKRDKFNDFTVQLGGPIIKDKLWFFASYQLQKDYYGTVGVDTSNPLALIKDSTDKYMGKVNWQVSSKHRLIATFHLDNKQTDNGLGVNSAPTTAWSRRSDTPTPGLSYNGVLSDKTVLDVRFSGFYGTVSGGPTDPNQPRDLTRFTDLDTGFTSGGHYYWYEVEPRRTTATAKLSHLADNFLGTSHDFKFGVQYSDAVAQGLYGLNNAVYTYTYGGTLYGYGYARQPFSYSGNSRNLGFYIDDTVRVSDRLSFNLGLRYDYNKAFSASQEELDQFGTPTGTTFPKRDFYTWKNFSPRIGFNWKLSGDGRTVLRGHWGRYHRCDRHGRVRQCHRGQRKTLLCRHLELRHSKLREPRADLEQRQPGRGSWLQEPRHRSVHPEPRARDREGPGSSAELRVQARPGLPAWKEIAGTYVQVPFTDDLGDNPTGRTFNIFQLTTPAGSGSSASPTPRAWGAT